MARAALPLVVVTDSEEQEESEEPPRDRQESEEPPGPELTQQAREELVQSKESEEPPWPELTQQAAEELVQSMMMPLPERQESEEPPWPELTQQVLTWPELTQGMPLLGPCPETQLDEETETEPDLAWAMGAPKDVKSTGDDVAMKIAESTKDGKSTGDDLTKKIAEFTQVKPKDVKAVIAALQIIAHENLTRTTKFVIPGVCQLKARKSKQERRRVIVFGNFRLEKAMEA